LDLPESLISETLIFDPSIFDSLESDLTNIENVIKSGPAGIEQELLDLENNIQHDISNDVNIVSKTVTSAVNNVKSKVQDFDHTIFSKGSPVNTEEENNLYGE
jgi:hypothetical protein